MQSISKIIAYYGSHNSGKTQVLTLLANILETNTARYELIDKEILQGGKDLIIAFKDKNTNHIIGIGTSGDEGECIQRNFEFFKKHNADLALTASRTKGITVDTINEYKKQSNSELIWIYATYMPYESHQNEINSTVAKALFFNEID